MGHPPDRSNQILICPGQRSSNASIQDHWSLDGSQAEPYQAARKGYNGPSHGRVLVRSKLTTTLQAQNRSHASY